MLKFERGIDLLERDIRAKENNTYKPFKSNATGMWAIKLVDRV